MRVILSVAIILSIVYFQDVDAEDKDFANILMNQSQKDLNSERFQQWLKSVESSKRFQEWENRATNSGKLRHWGEHINPDKPIDPSIEEMWQRFDGGYYFDMIWQWFSNIASYLEKWKWLYASVISEPTPLQKEDYLKYLLIKSIRLFIFDCTKELNPIIREFIRSAWENYLEEKISNCYDDNECRPYLKKFSFKLVSRIIIHIVVQPVKLGLKTTMISLKGVNNPVAIVADLAQFALEYYGYEEAGKVVGAGGNIASGAMAGFALGGPIGAAVGGVGGLCLWGVGEAAGYAAEKAT